CGGWWCGCVCLFVCGCVCVCVCVCVSVCVCVCVCVCVPLLQCFSLLPPPRTALVPAFAVGPIGGRGPETLVGLLKSLCVCVCVCVWVCVCVCVCVSLYNRIAQKRLSCSWFSFSPCMALAVTLGFPLPWACCSGVSSVGVCVCVCACVCV